MFLLLPFFFFFCFFYFGLKKKKRKYGKGLFLCRGKMPCAGKEATLAIAVTRRARLEREKNKGFIFDSDGTHTQKTNTHAVEEVNLKELYRPVFLVK